MQDSDKIDILMQQYDRAVSRRRLWEALWDECYSYTFPGRQNFMQRHDNVHGGSVGSSSQIYDATAPDAAEQLAAALLGELTPPFGKWLELSASSSYESQYGSELTKALEEAQDIFHEHLQKSNFLLEMQQAFLDSVVIGTSVLSFSEGSEMSDSAFQFSALPLHQVYVCEGSDGRLSHVFRRSDYSLSDLRHRFPELSSDEIERLEHSCAGGDIEENRFSVIEAVTLCSEGGYDYHALLHSEDLGHGSSLLRQGHYHHNPFIAFRWMKMPSEDYGRSPIMKLLPDIKTANKVVELILKNAAIAVTGIWQADDDGVLNPSNIKLVPGTIIPKAVGSKGLTPLQPSADFNLSQNLLDELRLQIRRGLLYDQLSPSFSPLATATEVLEKTDRASRIMGATYGRMQSELLLPLAYRGLDILKRRGLIAPLPIDGVNIRVRIQSPLARRQRLNQVQNVLQFVDYASRLRDSFVDVDTSQILSWLARQMEVPQNIIPQFPSASPISELALIPNNTSNYKEKDHA